jgi:hypothetical protein
VSESRRERLERVEQEILGEKAAALGRAGERLEQALAEVTNLAAALDAAIEPEARRRLAGEHEEARLRAARARLGLLIQREAVGFRHHRIVDQQYPEPPRPTTERRTEPRAPNDLRLGPPTTRA